MKTASCRFINDASINLSLDDYAVSKWRVSYVKVRESVKDGSPSAKGRNLLFHRLYEASYHCQQWLGYSACNCRIERGWLDGYLGLG